MRINLRVLITSIVVWVSMCSGVFCFEAAHGLGKLSGGVSHQKFQVESCKLFLTAINSLTDEIDPRDSFNQPLDDNFARHELEAVFAAGLIELLQKPDLYLIAQQIEKLQKEQNPTADSYARQFLTLLQDTAALLLNKGANCDEVFPAKTLSKKLKDNDSLNTVKGSRSSSIQNQPIVLRC